ncbi:hypothetical protein HID58_091896, partial [Brassica napus]
AEESFYHQRSHVTWLDKGDSNTPFYHRFVRARNSINQILFLKDDLGNIIDTKEGIMNHALEYYENLLEQLQILLCTLPLPARSLAPDVYKWCVNDLSLAKFTTTFGDWLSSSDSTCPTTLRRLAAQATIYKLWSERNNRLHNATSSTPQRIFKDLDRLIRNSILARKERRKFRGLMQVWLKHS